MNVCVFCAANDLDNKYVVPAREFGRLLGEAGHTLIWGGGDKGLMRVVAEGVREGGGKLIGISIEEWKHGLRKDFDEMIIMKDLPERKAAFLQRGDVLVVMVGGIGTLNEAAEMLEQKKHKHHNKPIIVLNSARFYDALRRQMEHMEQEGLLTAPLDTLIQFADTPHAAISIINDHRPEA